MTFSRTISTAATSAVLTALLLTGCGTGHAATPDPVAGRAHSPTTTSSTTATSAPATAGRAAARPRLIRYATGTSPGVAVHRRAQARRLHGAPAGFKRFIDATAVRVRRHSTCSDRSGVGVTVARLRTDGYAVGGIDDCSGYVALWSRVDGRWTELFGTQDAWPCGVLRRHRVPSAVVGGTCFAYHGDHREHRYHQA